MANNTNDVVVVLSGGQDSTTCLFWALDQFDGKVHCVTFAYGQRHQREIDSAFAVIDYARGQHPDRTINHEVIAVGPILQGTSPLVSDNELEQYASFHDLPGGLEKTFVPMRNQLFLTIAANFAFVRGVSILVTGVCQEDSGGYPDCRRDFIDAFEKTASLGTFNADTGFDDGLVVETPLMNLTKAESIDLAIGIGAYPALALTHTSYDGAYPPVGNDHATLLRAKGFYEAGLPDPLILRAVDEGRMPMPVEPNYADDVVAEIKKTFADSWPKFS